MKYRKSKQADWWFGVTDILATGVAHGADKVERVHLSIADETFDILQGIPVTRPFSETTRFIHHNIARLSYRSVAGVSAGVSAFARRLL
ncbi:MAG: hypothetical protein R6U69_07380 [Marinobacter sp.]|uniref:hypothetical protein n=1 Tax=Marinobacter sp. TaxID=50741 RepID=UPI00356305B2